MVNKIAASVPLPCLGKNGFTVLTYNVLIPNSQDGWWVYKYYCAGTKREHTEWAHREKLFKQQFATLASDVVCIQEAHAESFETDFGIWMREAGYAHALMKKGRMRCATFWKTSRFKLANKGLQHKDRTLICELIEVRPVVEATKETLRTEPSRRVFIVNGHLSAGHSSQRRLHQAHEALEAVTLA